MLFGRPEDFEASSHPRLELPKSVVKVDPETDLSVDRIDLRADKNDRSLDGRSIGFLIDQELRFCSLGFAIDRWRLRESFGSESIDADNSKQFIARFDPFPGATHNAYDDSGPWRRH